MPTCTLGFDSLTSLTPSVKAGAGYAAGLPGTAYIVQTADGHWEPYTTLRAELKKNDGALFEDSLEMHTTKGKAWSLNIAEEYLGYSIDKYLPLVNDYKVNGVKFRVDIDHCVVDISEALRAGVNTLTVYIATDLCNYNTKGQSGLKRGMQESAPYYPIVYREYPAPFGLTEPVALIPYGTAAVTGVELTVEGPADAFLGQKGLTYTVTAKNAKALATATLTMAIENLGSPIVEAQNGWYIISCIYEDGILTVVTGNHAGVTSEEAVTILTVTANAATVGTASVSIADAVLSAYTEEDEAFDSMVLADARVETKVDYSIYDVNRDGVANQLDLTRAQRFYGTADTVCDVDAAALWISRI